MAATQAEVDRVLAAYDNAQQGKDYSETIIMETQQISGDEYRMIWSTLYTGNNA